jgi:hypothetical protein
MLIPYLHGLPAEKFEKGGGQIIDIQFIPSTCGAACVTVLEIPSCTP